MGFLKKLARSIFMVLFVFSLLPLPLAQFAEPVMAAPGDWMKYPGQLSLGGQKYVIDSYVMKDAGLYKMWFTYIKTSQSPTWYGSQLAQLHACNLIAALENNNISAFFTSLSDLAATGDQDAIWNIINSASGTIGYADSSDGKTWIVRTPVSVAAAGGLLTSVGMPAVIKDTDGSYKMWYTRVVSTLDRTTLTNALNNLMALDPLPPPGLTATRRAAIDTLLDSTYTVIEYRTSPNGYDNWSPPVTAVAPTGATWNLFNSVSSPSVVLEAGTPSTYKMWYTRLKTSYSAVNMDALIARTVPSPPYTPPSPGVVNMDDVMQFLGGTNLSIYYTTSTNPASFSAGTVSLSPGTALWQSVSDPAVVKTGSTYEMWYTRSTSNLVTSTLLRPGVTAIKNMGWASLWGSLRAKTFADFLVDIAHISSGTLTTAFTGSTNNIGYGTTSNSGVTWTPQTAPEITGASQTPWGAVSAPSVVKAVAGSEMWFTQGLGSLSWQNIQDMALGGKLPIGYASTKILVSLVVSPRTTLLPKGSTHQFFASGTFNDSSNQELGSAPGIAWNSSDPTVASISASGLATALSPGVTEITATYGTVPSTPVLLTVSSAALQSIAVTAPGTIPLGSTGQMQAMGTYTDGTRDVTSIASWTSAYPSIASVDGAGVVRGLSQGTSLITANLSTRSNSATVTIGPPVYDHLVLSPTGPGIAKGDDVQFTLYEYLTDGTSTNGTATTVWSSDNSNVTAVPGTPGKFHVGTTATGTANIGASFTGSYGAHSTSTVLTVAPARMTALHITDVSPHIAAGLTQGTGLHLSMDLSDGTLGAALPGGAVVTWSSLDPAKATVDNTGKVTGLVPGTVTIRSGYNGFTATVVFTVDQPNLSTVEVLPASPYTTVTGTVQFSVLGTYSDGTKKAVSTDSRYTVAWSKTAGTGDATITTGGLAAGTTVGTVTITATISNILGLPAVTAGNTTLTVSAAPLTAISVTPNPTAVHKGLSVQFSASGTYGTGPGAITGIDITGQVTWTSETPGVATITSSGLATAAAETGSSVIRAAIGSVSGTATLNAAAKQVASIALSPGNQTIPSGRTQQYTATLTYTDTTTAQLPDSIGTVLTWSIVPDAGTGATTVSTGGLVTGRGTGVVTVRAVASTASPAGTPGTTTLNIGPAALNTITVTSTTVTNTPAGTTLNLVARGAYSDGTSGVDITGSVIWGSTEATIASPDATGKLYTYIAGTVIITASSQGRTGTISIRVDNATVSQVIVDPVGAVIARGTTRTFRAVAVYTDLSNRVVTAADGLVWSTTDVAPGVGVATITSGGVATGANKGTANIRAAFGGQTGSTTAVVTDAVLQSITVTATSYSVPAGRTQAFTAQGFYSDAPLVGVNLTDMVTWASDSPSVAGINSAGIATGYVSGSANITAKYRISSTPVIDITSAPVALTVGGPVLDSISVTPASTTVTFVAGTVKTIQFRATGVNSNGTTVDLTGSAVWTSTAHAVAADPPGGLVSIIGSGPTTISAGSGGKTGSSTLTVLADTVAPAVTILSPQDGLTTSNRNVTVTGNINDLAAVTRQLIVNGGAPITLTPDGSGNFSVGVVLNDGTNTLVAKATDAATPANVGVTSTITVKVDAQKPSIVLNSPVNGLLINTAQVIVSGTATGVNGVQYAYVSLNGVTPPTRVNVAANGSFSLPITLSPGRNFVCVTAYDKNNENKEAWMGTSGTREVNYDNVAPVVSINRPANNSVLSIAGATVSGAIDDPAVTTARLTVNGGAAVNVDVVSGAFSKAITLSPGLNTVSVAATDKAGNTASSPTVSVTLDTSTPSISLTSPANNLRTNAASQRVAGSIGDPSITQVQVWVNESLTPVNLPVSPVYTAGVFTRGDFSGMISNLHDGVNTIKATATNNASPQKTGDSGVTTVNVDTASPEIKVSFTDPTTSAVITVTSSEALSVPPTVSIDTAPATVVVMTQSDVNTWTGNFAIPAPAIYTVSVSATDVAGNEGTVTGSFTKETVVSTGTAAVPVKTPAATLSVETLGAVTADVSVTSQVNPGGNAGAPGSAPMAAGAYVDIKAGAELLNNLKSIYIEVPYDPSKLAGVLESSLKLFVWDVSTGTWKEVEGSFVDMVRHMICGTVTHLSTYGGFGKAPSVVIVVPEVGGGVVQPAPFVVGVLSVLDKVDQVSHKFIDTVTARSSDNLVTLTVPVNTKAEAANGSALWEIRIMKADPQPQLPAELKGVALVYDFGLDGATFSPAVTAVFPFQVSQLPAGASAANLRVAWKDAQGKWNLLPVTDTTVDVAGGKVTAKLTHFTPYTLVISYAPAAFTTSKLTVSPTSVKVNEAATVSITVTNTGDVSGNYSVALKVNNVVTGEPKTGTLAGGASTTVTFSVTQAKAGSYTIAIGSDSSTLTVTEAAPVQKPAAFTTSKLTVSPASVEVNKTATVSVTVTNTGDISGDYSVQLMVNGVAEGTPHTGTLAGGASKTETFSVTQSKAGSYTIAIGSDSSTLIVANPPAFTASNLLINPAFVKAGETTTISISIKNTGEVQGVCTVNLKVNGNIEATQNVSVPAGATQIVNFTLGEAQAGAYTIDVNGVTGTLTVNPAPTPPTTQPPVTPIPRARNWPLIGGGIAAGLLLVVVVVLVILRRSRRAGGV